MAPVSWEQAATNSWIKNSLFLSPYPHKALFKTGHTTFTLIHGKKCYLRQDLPYAERL